MIHATRPQFRDPSLTEQIYEVLQTIRRNQDTFVSSDVSEYLPHMNGGHVTASLNNLERRGAVKRVGRVGRVIQWRVEDPLPDLRFNAPPPPGTTRNHSKGYKCDGTTKSHGVPPRPEKEQIAELLQRFDQAESSMLSSLEEMRDVANQLARLAEPKPLDLSKVPEFNLRRELKRRRN